MSSVPSARTLPPQEEQARDLAPLSLRANFSWTFVGNVLYAGSQWGILAALTKLGSPRMVGQFSLGLAITAPIILFANLQLRAIQSTDAKGEYSFGHYLGLRGLTTCMALATVALVALAGDHERDTLWVILCVGAAKSFEALSDVTYGLMQKHERMDRMAISMILRGLLAFLAVGVLVYITGQLLWGILGMAIVWLAMLILFDWRHAAQIEPWNLGDVDIASLQRLVVLAFPLGLVMALISLNSNIPRYFIAHYLGEADLGYFASVAYLMVAGNLVIAALGQAAGPRLAQYYAINNRRAFRTLLARLIFIGLGLGGLALLVARLFGREILTLLYEADYAQHADVLVWLAGAAGISFMASFLGYAMTAARYFRVQIALQLASLSTVTLGCLVLVPKMGMIGAAQSILLGSVVQLLGGLGVNIIALRHMGTGSRSDAG